LVKRRPRKRIRKPRYWRHHKPRYQRHRKPRYRKSLPWYKKKLTKILFIILAGAGIWASLLLTASPAQIAAYRNFLIISPIIFFSALLLGAVATKPKPSRAVIGGPIIVEGGADVNVRIRARGPKAVSRKVMKIVLIIGFVVTLLGFTFGIWPEWHYVGYATVGIGGTILGVGLGLLIFRKGYGRW